MFFPTCPGLLPLQKKMGAVHLNKERTHMENATVDGDRLLMVAMELTMSLFAMLYAFPHVPARILGAGDEAPRWFAVKNHGELCAALLSMLQASPVVAVCMQGAGFSVDDLDLAALCDPAQLDAKMGLNLYAEDVPIGCQQMYHALCGAYAALLHPPLISGDTVVTREWMQRLYSQQGLTGASVGKVGQDRTALVKYCATQTVAWLQQHFAGQPLFYHPQGLTAVCV